MKNEIYEKLLFKALTKGVRKADYKTLIDEVSKKGRRGKEKRK